MQTFRAWKYDAVQTIRELLPDLDGLPFTTFDVSVLTSLFSDLPCPDDGRWWGQAMQEVKDLGLIQRLSFSTRSESQSRRGAMTALWEVA